MKQILAALASLCLFSASAFAQNAIVTENQLPGTPQSQWDLVGRGSSALEGYASEISVNHGTTVSFKIKTTATSWRIDIYRLGYYQGNGARLITTIPMSGAASQPTPVIDATTGMVDAGNWAVTASWSVPSTAVSGVYIAHLVNNVTPSQANHIPFVVRADESTSDLLFQTADTTWQAYNGWPCGLAGVPSNNLYGGSGPGGDSAPGRAYKVSYNRPFSTRESCGLYAAPHDFLFGAEFAGIFWLERNGYDVSYIAGADVARFPSLLTRHKVFMSVGHDEYWDGVARTNLQAALDAGVNLAFFSGNEVYWKTRWEPSIAGTQTNYRTLVCYKETRANGPLDPLDASPTWTWTGTWRDPRNSPPADGGKPENRLTGTLFEVDSYRSDSIEVPYEMSRLRFWRNTPRVTQTAPGGKTTLTRNILGYEWDGSPDNGFRPPGLIDLSSTTLPVSQLLLDYGSMTGDGSATHNLTLYKHPTSGARVFGAGTVFWAWGLSERHDGVPTPIDRDIQQATVNLLADMGAQPTTLQSGLAPAAASNDTTAPTTTISSPDNGATFVEGQAVTIAGTASDVGGRVAGVEVSVDDGANWVRARGGANWTFGWNATPGTHVIRARATDDSLNTESSAPSVTVTAATGGASLFGSIQIPERQTTIDPGDVELGMKFSPKQSGVIRGVRFWKSSINAAPHIASLWNASGSLLAQTSYVNETATGWQVALFATPVFVSSGATYTASYHTRGFYSSTTQYFTTPVSTPLLTAPVNAGVYTYSTTPVFPNQIYQSENYWVDVLFEPSPPPGPPAITSALTASASVGMFFSYQITATNGPTGFSASGLPTGLTVNSATGLISGSPTAAGTYNIQLGATNALGAGTATLVLTVGAAPSSFSLFSLNDTPALVTVNDTSPVELGVKFIAASNGSITGMRFYKGPQNVGTHIAHLWSGVGALLASATFTGETASGWQTVQFTQPVAITGGATYVASYHSNGYYSASGGYFTTARVNGPLTAPASAASGGNGVYAYGPAGRFPINTFNANNYWVDVLFAPAPPGPPVIQSPLTASGVTGSPFTYQISATSTPTSYGAAPLPAGLSVNTSTGQITGTPTESGTFNVTLSATNAAGAGTATLVLTIAAAVNPPVIQSPLTASGVTGSPFTYQIAATNNPTSYTATGLPAGLSINASTGQIAGTPAESGTFNVTLSATNAAGAGTATLVLTIAAAVNPPVIQSPLTASGVTGSPFNYQISATNTPTSYGAAPLPGGLSVNTSTGQITGTPTESGTFNVTLSATNAAGAGTATLVLTIAAAVNPPVIQSPLTASGVTGSPFTYQISATNTPTSYGAAPLPAGLSVNTSTGQITGTPTASGTFTVTLSATNAAGAGTATLVLTIAAAVNPPVIQPPLTAAAIIGSPFTYQIAATNNPTSYTATGLPAGLALNTATGAITGTPTTSGAFTVSLTATNAAGTGAATLALTVGAAQGSSSLFSLSEIPARVSVNDPSPVELGVKFVAVTNGSITGMRFYKGPQNVGTHVARLWSASGVLLASATFVGETASGWQTTQFAQAVAITAGATYVASYHSNGFYSANNNFFTTARVSGPLTAPASGASGGNGVYAYGSAGVFPRNSFLASNYWVDVLFQASTTQAASGGASP